MDVISGGAGMRRNLGLAPVLLLILLLLAIAAGVAFSIGSPSGPSLAVAPTTGPTLGPTSTPGASGPIEGSFTACVPTNNEYRTGTDTSASVPGVGGDTKIDQRRGFTWQGTITATDPRFSGTHYYSFDSNVYTLASGVSYTSWAEGHRIENEGGVWQGTNFGLNLPDGSHGGLARLTGEGGYQGLTALLITVDGDCFFSFEGIVIEVPDPPVPYTGG